MRTSDLHFDLPASLIAQRPSERRDAARLLVLDRTSGRIQHRRFSDLPEFLHPADALVLNVSRVLPARFVARRKTGAKLGGLFVREALPGRWEVLLTGAGRVKDGEQLAIENGQWTMTVISHGPRGQCDVAIDPPDAAADILNRVGAMPLPPYIRRNADDRDLAALDREQYQTVYASADGSVAAPTAGLHFTPELLERIRAIGVTTTDVTLHVGLGTFQPIEVEDLADHSMHSEWFELSTQTAAVLNKVRASGGRIIAVGTTCARVLETCASERALEARSGTTDILIYPPYRFGAVDALITNFHLPGSTLLALVFAFAGRERMLATYREAIKHEYRFFSYGDAMLIV